ncbi:MAG: cytochrome c [Bdellovibrionota bacterium]
MLGFNNCGVPLAKVSLKDSDLSSTGNSCDSTRLSNYKAGFYPFMRSNCVSCHIEGGPGLGTFASTDLATSFASFSGAGVTKIGYMATNPAHKPPYTGIQHKPAIDSLSTSWLASEKAFLACVSKSENGGVDESILTAPKVAPSIYSGLNVTQKLTWDLELANDLDGSVKRALPAQISVDVKVLYLMIGGKNYAKGYIFTNPVMQLKNSSQQIVIEGLFFYINETPITSQTTFTSLSRVVAGTTAVPLMKATANTLIEPIATTDTFQLYIRRILPTSGVDESPAPLTPILNLADSDIGVNTHTNSVTASTFIMRDAGISRWCLSESPTRPANTEAPCNSGMTGDDTVNGWSLVRPTSFKFSAGDGLKKLYLWVANENLKINETAAEAFIQLDTVAPAAPTIASVTVGSTQVATMSVSHPVQSDVTGWCVFEQNSIKAKPVNPPGFDNACWKWTDNGAKPATVGFRESGSRDIYIYVRDIAGNVSASSNKMTATNPFGAITLSQLTGNLGARSVFKNRCLTCHGDASAPGYSQLQLGTYDGAAEVANSGLLVSRINNTLSPMPNINGGLMSQAERDLIRLWTMPEEGRDPLP